MITHKWFPAHPTTGMSKMSQSNKRQILATPKEYKMDRFELDQLAMETKANGSSFPLLLKNSKHIIDRVVSTWLDMTGSTSSLRGVQNLTIALLNFGFEPYRL